ncbi:MAG TPA: cytochrome c [Solirubrobacteraceae bacterium]|jgi:mono/diheme cytochrome c family protein
MQRAAHRLAPALVAIVALATAAAGCGGDTSSESPPPLYPAQPPQTEPPPATPADIAAEEAKESPKSLFAHTCGTCHTLAAAGTTAPIGPNLDRAGHLTTRYVLRRIQAGSLDAAMPADLLVGRSARRVATYVARVSRGTGNRRR